MRLALTILAAGLAVVSISGQPRAGDGVELAAGFAGLAQQLVVRSMADEGLLQLRGANRHHPHAADDHRGAHDLSSTVLDQ